MNNKYILKIINKNNICISRNPRGIDKDWAKSYMDKFCKYEFEKYSNIYRTINFLDISFTNMMQNKLCLKVFKNINTFISLKQIGEYLKSKFQFINLKYEK